MNTAWHLIFAWQEAVVDAQRTKAQADTAQEKTAGLELQLKKFLMEKGPLRCGDRIFLPPVTLDAPIQSAKLLDAITTPLDPTPPQQKEDAA